MAYMTGQIYRCSYATAEALIDATKPPERAVMREHSDGTYTVTFLSPTPMQPGQVEFRED